MQGLKVRPEEKKRLEKFSKGSPNLLGVQIMKTEETTEKWGGNSAVGFVGFVMAATFLSLKSFCIID